MARECMTCGWMRVETEFPHVEAGTCYACELGRLERENADLAERLAEESAAVTYAYQDGYEAGCDAGYSDGHADGYEEGRSEGFEDGWESGYEHAMLDCEN